LYYDQPNVPTWAVIARKALRTLVIIACHHWIANTLFAIPVAISGGFLGMFFLHCLHLPAVAVTFIAVFDKMES